MTGPTRVRARRAVLATRVNARLPTGGARRLPDFMIVGAQRCGTTSLFQWLAAHPEITPPLGKELQFFSDRFGRGERWYRSHFPFKSRQTMTFEATPYYLFHPLAAVRARSAVPDAKILVLLRNPVDRAFSHYRHSLERGHEHLSFEDALRAEPERIDGEAERLAADPTYRSTAHRVFSYAARGRYADQVERWLQAFGRDRVLVVRSEDLYSEPAETYRSVLGFLGVSPSVTTDFAVHARGPTVASASMSPDLRGRLVEEFAPHNRRLVDVAARSFDWDR